LGILLFCCFLVRWLLRCGNWTCRWTSLKICVVP
jgi:hypothetical protein